MLYNKLTMQNILSSSMPYISEQIINNLLIFLPKILGALIIYLVGVVIAKLFKKVLNKVFNTIKLSAIINRSPLQFASESEDFGQKAVVFLTNAVYWLIMLVVLYAAVATLGLESLTLIFENILSYLPNVVSALFIIAAGAMVAGWSESFVKNSVKSISKHSALFFGKISSYFVITIAILIALSELGIAKEFITILFIGFVTIIALGMGLALGLGGKDVVSKILDNWYSNSIKKKSKK
jgi:hypothetical protein